MAVATGAQSTRLFSIERTGMNVSMLHDTEPILFMCAKNAVYANVISAIGDINFLPDRVRHFG